MFVRKDKQLKVVHHILYFKPLSDKFQDVGHTIRASDPWLARIDISMLGFLAREVIVPIEFPSCRSPREAVVLRKEIASLRLSLETEIN